MNTIKLTTVALVCLSILACNETQEKTATLSESESLRVNKKERVISLGDEDRGAPTAQDVDGIFGIAASPQRKGGGYSAVTVVNPIIQQTFYTDAKFAKERYLAYKINLKFISDDMAKSRSVLLKTLELYGFPVSSNMHAVNNRLVQNAHLKIKTDSLYGALNLLKDAGVLIQESTNVEDFTNHVKISNAPYYSGNLQTDKTLPQDTTKNIKKIYELPIRDKVEWADITITIEGTQELMLQVDEKESALKESFLSVQNQLLGLVAFAIENILWIIVVVMIGIGVKKGVVKTIRKK